MTSENNNERCVWVSRMKSRTIAFLKDNNYFGMPEDQITITMQECIPAVKNMEGEIAVDEHGHIIKKPHGHGDVHFCLYRVLSSSARSAVGPRHREVAEAVRSSPRVFLPGHEHHELRVHALCGGTRRATTCTHGEHVREASSVRAGDFPPSL